MAPKSIRRLFQNHGPSMHEWPMKKHDLDTPCLVIDLDILEDNLKKMQVGADAAGKKLRPHAKMHKCSTLA